MHPDWLGSPQHVIGGAILAAIVIGAATRTTNRWWLLATLAIGVTATAELVIELVEYPLLYGGDAHPAVYYDTIADMASTLVGALIGTAVALILRHARSSRASTTEARRPSRRT